MTASGQPTRTVVITGGTSGLGAVAADRLRAAPGARLVLGVRRVSPGVDEIPLDLGSVASVRSFASTVRARLDDGRVHALVLNAGVIRADADGRTGDGVETTFAVNHLSHYLLLRLLMPVLADGAVVIWTTSGTHDPATATGLAAPRHADADLLAHPGDDPGVDPRPRVAGQHAYTASKLCGVLAARGLAGHPDARARRITAVAFCPGQVFGTGLAEDLTLPWRMAWRALGTPALRRPLQRLNRHLNSPAAAGAVLADLASGRLTPAEGRVYATLRRGRVGWPDPSSLARDDEVMRAVWHASARLTGLSVDA